MTARNDVTGDFIQTKGATEKYRAGWDRIFGKKEIVTDDKKESNQNDSAEKSQSKQ